MLRGSRIRDHDQARKPLRGRESADFAHLVWPFWRRRTASRAPRACRHRVGEEWGSAARRAFYRVGQNSKTSSRLRGGRFAPGLLGPVRSAPTLAQSQVLARPPASHSRVKVVEKLWTAQGAWGPELLMTAACFSVHSPRWSCGRFGRHQPAPPGDDCESSITGSTPVAASKRIPGSRSPHASLF